MKNFFLLSAAFVLFSVLTVNAQWGLTGNVGTNPPTNYLGTKDAKDLVFKTNAVEKMRILSNGNVGLGQVNPIHKLQFLGNISLEETGSILFGQNYPTSAATWGQWGIEYNEGYGGLNFWKPFNSNNSGNCFLFLKDDGNVGIGTSNPGTYKLAVNGSIHAKEVVIDLIGWSDFVFDNSFKLKSIAEVEKYINEHKHLPDVPSSSEVEKNGVAIGQMESILLQKVEELTLYIIMQNKKIEELDKQIQDLKKN